MGGLWNIITGKDSRRQKRNYNASLDRYNNYAREAQATIENLSRNLQQSMQSLQSLEQQKYYHGLKGHELQSHVSQYEAGLRNLEQQKSTVATESDKLKLAFESFKNKAPALESKISEIEQLPNIFQNLYDTVAKQKESLKGLTEEEAAIQIKKHHQDVENLKKQRIDTENKIRNSMKSITSEHQNLGAEKSNLEQRLSSYKLQQDRLLLDTSNFDQSKSQLENIIREYKDEQDHFNNEYTRYHTQTQTQEQQLKDYIRGAQNQLDAFGRDVEFTAGKYRKGAQLTGLVQGLGLAALTWGIGSGIGSLSTNALPWSTKATVLGNIASGVKSLAPVIGIGHYMNTANISHKLNGYEQVNLGNHNSTPDLSQIARLGLGSPKVSIPELGGLKQSLEHFNMPIVPKLKDLPQLHESLGKIVSLKDIEGLTLGLPQMTSASGKKYSHEVLYNPEFIKKLRKVSKTLAMPYLKPVRSGQNIGGVSYA